MIKKYKTFLNEKLTDNLKGFDENSLKQQFFNGEISISKYMRLCKQYNFSIPSRDEIKQALNKLLLNDKYINITFYINDIRIYCNEEPSETIMKEFFINGKINLNLYLDLCDKYKYQLPTNEEIHDSISNYKDYDDMLIEASKYNFLDLVKLAIENGSEYNKETFIPLKHAMKNNNLEMIEYLIEHGSEYNYINVVLENSIEKDDIKTIKYLLECGAEVDEYLINKCKNEEIKQLLQKYYNKQHD